MRCSQVRSHGDFGARRRCYGFGLAVVCQRDNSLDLRLRRDRRRGVRRRDVRPLGDWFRPFPRRKIRGICSGASTNRAAVELVRGTRNGRTKEMPALWNREAAFSLAVAAAQLPDADIEAREVRTLDLYR